MHEGLYGGPPAAGRALLMVAATFLAGLVVVTGAGAVAQDAGFVTGIEGGGLAVQPSTGNVFVNDDAGGVHVYSPTGTPLQSFNWPPGAGNDVDIDFINEAAMIGGTAVPSGALLAAAGGQNQLYVIDHANGPVLVR